MPRSYRQISQYEKEIIELYNQGMTLRAIAEKLGFTHKQVQEFKTRYNKKQRMKEAGQAIHKKGRPNQKWVTDISYIPTTQGNCYLSVIRDLYDNSIVSYQISKDMTVKLVLDTIKKAMKKEKVTAELQLHSDQGAQYVSHEYFTLTQSYGITPSMSRRGNPYDNALAENFFSILKTECIHRVKLAGYEEASLLISEYINFYNKYRIQTKTKLTPLEKRNQFVA